MKNFKFILIAFFSILLVGCNMGGNNQGNNSVEGIVFDTMGGDELASITDLNVGDQVKLPTPTREGYNFLGWYTDKEYTNTMLPIRYTYNGPVTLYAKWFVGQFKIFFSSEVAIDLETITLNYGDTITLEDPVNPSYDFVGWFLDGEPFNLTTMPGRDIRIEARWEPKKLNVSLDLNGGNASDDFKNVINDFEAGSTINLESPVKNGYIFVGWFDGTEKTAKQYTSRTPIYSSVNLVARYRSLNEYEESYQLNLELNGGSLDKELTNYTTGEKLVLPIPTKVGYTFNGWYTSLECVGNTVTEISQNQTGTLNLFAGWKENRDVFTVTYVSLNKVETVEVKAGERAENKAIPTNGFELVWYHGRDVYDFNQLISEDITLVANFKGLENVIQTLVPDIAYDNIQLITKTTLEDVDVAIAWSTSDSNTISRTGITNPARHDSMVTLTAQFRADGKIINHPFEVLVPGIVFQDLSEIKPVFGYVYASSHRGFTETAINTLDVVNVAFGRVTSESTCSVDSISNLSTLLQIRKTGTRVVLSLGGYGSGGVEFSNTAASAEKRKIFAQSILEVLETYHFDGIDLDWEYPGFETGRETAVDRLNYTLMLQTIYTTVKAANPDYLITAAVPGGKWGYERYDVPKLNELLDYIHLMTYDFHGSTAAVHHTALYGSTNTSSGSNASDSVKIYVDAGASKEKLVIGCAFYGRVYKLSGPANTEYGVGATNVISSGDHINYHDIINTYYKNETISKRKIYYFDPKACAATIYDPVTYTVISFDDANTISSKCKYVWSEDIAGIMYWENGEDQSDLLLKALQKGMK